MQHWSTNDPSPSTSPYKELCAFKKLNQYHRSGSRKLRKRVLPLILVHPPNASFLPFLAKFCNKGGGGGNPRTPSFGSAIAPSWLYSLNTGPQEAIHIVPSWIISYVEVCTNVSTLLLPDMCMQYNKKMSRPTTWPESTEHSVLQWCLFSIYATNVLILRENICSSKLHKWIWILYLWPIL